MKPEPWLTRREVAIRVIIVGFWCVAVGPAMLVASLRSGRGGK